MLYLNNNTFFVKVYFPFVSHESCLIILYLLFVYDRNIRFFYIYKVMYTKHLVYETVQFEIKKTKKFIETLFNGRQERTNLSIR